MVVCYDIRCSYGSYRWQPHVHKLHIPVAHWHIGGEHMAQRPLAERIGELEAKQTRMDANYARLIGKQAVEYIDAGENDKARAALGSIAAALSKYNGGT